MPGEVVTKGHGNGRHRELGEEGSTPQKLMDEPEAWTEAKGVRGVKNDVKPDDRGQTMMMKRRCSLTSSAHCVASKAERRRRRRSRELRTPFCRRCGKNEIKSDDDDG